MEAVIGLAEQERIKSLLSTKDHQQATDVAASLGNDPLKSGPVVFAKGRKRGTDTFNNFSALVFDNIIAHYTLPFKCTTIGELTVYDAAMESRPNLLTEGYVERLTGKQIDEWDVDMEVERRTLRESIKMHRGMMSQQTEGKHRHLAKELQG